MKVERGQRGRDEIVMQSQRKICRGRKATAKCNVTKKDCTKNNIPEVEVTSSQYYVATLDVQLMAGFEEQLPNTAQQLPIHSTHIPDLR